MIRKTGWGIDRKTKKEKREQERQRERERERETDRNEREKKTGKQFYVYSDTKRRWGKRR
jgi:hypothetical protein